ncbi:efflux RND transporter periplasmic adaptor subunit [Bradyrhizobium sp. Tv2a-2]|uniref:efflux RND transporter periplasmic adaptor subunit n=1 Tax=Bradyrhizobium sp. Tv2a-2 TaxID=113395 RepID=UPI000465B88A|nr:efflux RND transporter periplasmic adaptor subunit [Bradyrhizobium sp. Tv2a-2]
MNETVNPSQLKTAVRAPSTKRWRSVWWLGGLGLLVIVGYAGYVRFEKMAAPVTQPPAAPPVTVSKPLQQDVDARLGFLGQFAAVNRVEVRPQVGGTLVGIHFKDGQIVHKGDLLFTIDPRPYEIKLAQANAALETAKARVALANNELSRARSLKRDEFATQETVDQRTNDQDASHAAVDDAEARVRDAKLDLEYSRVTAPFTGRIGERQVSIGALIAGSRAATSPTTLLATLVSLDPLYLNFDMSERDYLTYIGETNRHPDAPNQKVFINLTGEKDFKREGTLDFLDNALNRASGTIRARATVSNSDLNIAPGQFARIRATIAPPSPALLLPDSAVLLDQSQHLVMTVSAEGKVVPKIVETGDVRGGLRVIKSGLSPDDRVVIDGLVRAMPGASVTPQQGSIRFQATADGQG